MAYHMVKEMFPDYITRLIIPYLGNHRQVHWAKYWKNEVINLFKPLKYIRLNFDYKDLKDALIVVDKINMNKKNAIKC